jgi:regulator of sigma D
MSLMTLTAAITGGHHPDYYAGRADAHDEHRDGATLTELATRAHVIADLHPSTQYALGYTDRVLELRHEHTATITAQTDLAHTQTTERTA